MELIDLYLDNGLIIDMCYKLCCVFNKRDEFNMTYYNTPTTYYSIDKVERYNNKYYPLQSHITVKEDKIVKHLYGRHGYFHNIDKPAIQVYYDNKLILEEYYYKGRLHRDVMKGPAVINYSRGTKKYHQRLRKSRTIRVNISKHSYKRIIYKRNTKLTKWYVKGKLIKYIWQHI